MQKLCNCLLQQVSGAGLSDVFTVSVIQTGYANGSSTKFLKDEMVSGDSESFILSYYYRPFHSSCFLLLPSPLPVNCSKDSHLFSNFSLDCGVSLKILSKIFWILVITDQRAIAESLKYVS